MDKDGEFVTLKTFGQNSPPTVAFRSEISPKYLFSNPCHRGSFVKELCNQINEFGKKDDIIGLVTRTNMEQRPLIISTLTKKFYVAKSPNRGHYYELECDHNKAMEVLSKFQTESSKPGGSEATRFDTRKIKV
ncbi:hypothetical protein FQA39_LY18893 [Lamprigera yunnana]|nr:hypothetical protein FQA39_LY18893 [Lamprigera yunnana]